MDVYRLICSFVNCKGKIAVKCRFSHFGAHVEFEAPEHLKKESPTIYERVTQGPEVIKLFSCSTQLSMKFILLVNVEMPTIILTFISRINDWLW